MEDLTPKQKAAVVAYCQTGTVPAAAEKLGATARTTRDHLERARVKLGADDLRGLLGAVIRTKAVTLEELVA
jgi:DNA-binding NarL/FixJ family response regulator